MTTSQPTTLDHSEVVDMVNHIQRTKVNGKHVSVNDKIVQLTELESNLKGSGCIMPVKQELSKLECRRLFRDEIIDAMEGESFFVTMSTFRNRQYNEDYVLTSFRLRLQQAHRSIFARRWKTQGKCMSGYIVVESRNKQGMSICPHIHAVVRLPEDVFIHDYTPTLILHAFQYGVREYSADGLYRNEPKVVKDMYGHPVFSGIEAEEIDMDLTENLGDYLTKHLFVGNTMDGASGIYKFHGDEITKIN